MAAWSTRTHTHTLLSHLMSMSRIDTYKPNRSVHASATRATPRLLIVAQTGDPVLLIHLQLPRGNDRRQR